MTRDGYNAYITYLALQRHFSTSYDYFQYNGKVKASTEAYQKRNDMWSFEKLTKILPQEHLVDFYVAHFLDNPKCWIKSMSKDKLEAYQSRYKRLSSTFKHDLTAVYEQGPAKCLEYTNDIPIIHKMALSGDISYESLCLLDLMFPFIEKHAKEVTIPFVFPEHIKKCQKYQPFVKQKTQESYKYLVDIAKDVLL